MATNAPINLSLITVISCVVISLIVVMVWPRFKTTCARLLSCYNDGTIDRGHQHHGLHLTMHLCSIA